METSKTLTTAQVAERLSISCYVVRELLKSGKIPGIKLTTSEKAKWRIEEKDLEAWIASQKEKNSRGRVRK